MLTEQVECLAREDLMDERGWRVTPCVCYQKHALVIFLKLRKLWPRGAIAWHKTCKRGSRTGMGHLNTPGFVAPDSRHPGVGPCWAAGYSVPRDLSTCPNQAPLALHLPSERCL